VVTIRCAFTGPNQSSTVGPGCRDHVLYRVAVAAVNLEPGIPQPRTQFWFGISRTTQVEFHAHFGQPVLCSEVIQDALDGREFCRHPVQLRNGVPYHGKAIRIRCRHTPGSQSLAGA
jgi:hypothetical protein